MPQQIKYFLLPIIVWVVSQTLKLIIRLTFRKEKCSWEHVRWIYEFGDGAPSTHSAIVISSLYVLAYQRGVDAVFGFAFTASLIFMYSLVEGRKRQEILESFLGKSIDPAIRGIVEDKKMFDISGHNYFEVVMGILTGIVMGYLLQMFLF